MLQDSYDSDDIGTQPLAERSVFTALCPGTGITLNQVLPKPGTHLHLPGTPWKQQKRNQAQSPPSSLPLWLLPLQQISFSEMQEM